MTVLKGDKEGPVWLFLRKRGKMFKDDINIVLENFVRTDSENPEEGQALCVCKFDTLDSSAYKFYGGCFEAFEDSDGSDGAAAAVRVSGASAATSAAGITQFGQALSSGRLNGDELRSVLENLPRLAQALADGLGVTVGELRRMGEAGELTGQKVAGALLPPETESQVYAPSFAGRNDGMLP